MSTRRVATAWDLPLESLRCAAAGRHLGFLINDAKVTKVTGWGKSVDSRRVEYACHCGRTLVEVIDWKTGEVLTRSGAYDGGTLPLTPVNARAARLILLRLQTERAAGVPRVGAR